MRALARWGLPLVAGLLAAALLGSCGGDYIPEGVPGVGGGAGGAAGAAPTACGDGIREDPEECDDHNTIDADGCEGDCTLPRCENKIVDPGEICFGDPYQLVPTTKERADDLALLDCDDDGDLDAITVDSMSQSITVLRNDGSGLLGNPYHQSTGLGLAGGVLIQSLAVGQFDSTPAADLVVTGSLGTTPSFGIMVGSDHCAFAELAPVSEIDPAARAVSRVQLDGGPLDDLLLVQFEAGESAIGSYSFDAPGMHITPTDAVEATSVAVGDLNGDGTDDAVLTDAAGDALHVARGDQGGFSMQFPVAVGGEPCAVALGDVNGDGLLDALTANRADDTVTVAFGNGAFAFTPQPPDASVGAQQFAIPASAPASLALGDIDADGDLDVVTANGAVVMGRSSVTVLLNDGSGVLTIARPQTEPEIPRGFPMQVGPSPQTVRLGDLNGDGALDIITASDAVESGTSEVSLLLSCP